jgi:hypothetical protein
MQITGREILSLQLSAFWISSRELQERPVRLEFVTIEFRKNNTVTSRITKVLWPCRQDAMLVHKAHTSTIKFHATAALRRLPLSPGGCGKRYSAEDLLRIRRDA